MKDKDSQGKKGGDWKKIVVIIILCLLAIVLTASVAVAIYFAVGPWWNGNIVKHPPQPLDVAVAVLTILVTIVAIVIGTVTLWTRRDWNKFKEETWKAADKRLENLEESQKEILYLNKHIKIDPLLQHDEDIKQLFDFAKGFINGQDMLPLKFYFAGRAYENGYDRDISKEKQLVKSIQYYEKALNYEKALGYEIWPPTKRRICQAMGFSLSELGKAYSAKGNQRKAKKRYENAREAFKDADEAERSSQALDSQGNACIKLAEMASNQEGKAKLLTEAIKCFDDAIQMKDKLVRQWWATYHFDRARALVLRADKYNRKDLDEVAKELNKAIRAVVPEPVGFEDGFDDFEDIEQQESKIKRLLERLGEAILKARLK